MGIKKNTNDIQNILYVANAFPNKFTEDINSMQIVNRTIVEINNDIVSKIGSYAFCYCSNLTSTSFPSCTTIDNAAFYNCNSLTSADFSVCTTIGNHAFYSCSNLTSVNFPSCTTIGSSAFHYCNNLISTSFPSCTTIGHSAFEECYSLTSASFPVCTTIGIYAFSFVSCLALHVGTCSLTPHSQLHVVLHKSLLL